MITVKATDRTISAVPNHPITSGSVGLPVSFIFSEAWDGLTKIAVFKGSGTAKDVALLTDECVVPAEVLVEYGDLLWIGVYGANGDGDIVMPTMWCKAGLIVEGTAPSESDPADPTPNWVAQVQAAAASALEKAEAVEAAAAAGDFDGEDGADGTTFTPSVASNGDLSWTNDGGKQNPETVNIKGTTGDPGAKGDPGSSTWVVVAAPEVVQSKVWEDSDEVEIEYAVFFKTDLQGRTGQTPQVGDIIAHPGYFDNNDKWETQYNGLYVITGINSDTVSSAYKGQIIGPKGDTGDTGTAATVTTGTTTTLAPGSYATVTNTGTSSAAVLNFGIPKGEKGDTGNPTDAQVQDAVDDWLDENVAQETGYVLDRTLSMQNAAAPADLLGSLGLTDEAKEALLDCFAHVVWVDEHGQDYYDALEEALYNTTWAITNNLTNCTTSNEATSVTKGGSYSATITASTGYVMTGATVSITMGGNDITATAYSNGVISIPAVTGALVITISAAAKTVSSIEAVFTQGDNTVYWWDNLNYLKQWLVVTATYDDSSTSEVSAAEYELSGTLSASTSTVTVTYSGKTDTFTVTVNDGMSYSLADGDLLKVKASAGHSETYGWHYDTNDSSKRRVFVLNRGTKSILNKQDSYSDSNYYPIPIPPTATGVSIKITPTTQFTGSFLSNLVNGKYDYTGELSSGWVQNTYTATFTAGQYGYLYIGAKYNSSGTSYPTEPSALTVTFTTS